MTTIKTKNWYETSDGSPRGYIKTDRLREFWIHTGTACNLRCDFCLEGSAPGDQRLQIPRLNELKTWINDALDAGVQRFSFTGGEPFLCKDLIELLAFASQYRPCLVLTNGTEALHKRMEVLTQALKDSPHPVSFRVSLDYACALKHDAGRGAGNFAQALMGLKMLHRAGFAVSVARHMDKDEDTAKEERAFSELFVREGLPEAIALVAFPDFLTPGAGARVPEITTDCMTRYHTEKTRAGFMCAFSRMLVKQAGRFHLYACTLVDDDPDYDLGGALAPALEQTIYLKHHRCYSCFAYGASCSG